jgi:uncharacterized protein (DUF433 family)
MAKTSLTVAGVAGIGDPRELPAYTISEAAQYLSIPKATLRSWVMGATYRKNGIRKHFKSVIRLPVADSQLLSFFNLAEAHVLRALRTRYRLALPSIRRALSYVQKRFGWERPLIQQDFKTDGASLFVERLGQIEEASSGGQLIMQDVLLHLERLEWEDELVARLYPFTRGSTLDAPKSVMIDPRYSFGRPILHQSRIPTAVIAERYKAGDSILTLAEDYGCPPLEIEEGIRCELRLDKAA